MSGAKFPLTAAMAAATKAVVAIEVSLSPGAAVGALGSPVNVGEAKLAFNAISPCTKAVVAIEVSLSAAAGVGAVGLPVSAGEAKLAFKSNAVCWAVETGLLTSDVLSTLPRPTSPLTRAKAVLNAA
jgi:hypothetical protein